MKSIKPGRGPSMMSGVVGIFMIGFGILWTVIAAQASGIFALFGVLWTGIAIAMTVYNFKNATGKTGIRPLTLPMAMRNPIRLTSVSEIRKTIHKTRAMLKTNSALIAELLLMTTLNFAITAAKSYHNNRRF